MMRHTAIILIPLVNKKDRSPHEKGERSFYIFIFREGQHRGKSMTVYLELISFFTQKTVRG